MFKIFGELNAFFHQPMHYPDVEALSAFLGSRKGAGAYGLISEAYYRVLPSLLPPDLMTTIEEGELDHRRVPHIELPTRQPGDAGPYLRRPRFDSRSPMVMASP